MSCGDVSITGQYGKKHDDEKRRAAMPHTMSAQAPPPSQIVVLGKKGKSPEMSCKFAMPAAMESVDANCASAS